MVLAIEDLAIIPVDVDGGFLAVFLLSPLDSLLASLGVRYVDVAHRGDITEPHRLGADAAPATASSDATDDRSLVGCSKGGFQGGGQG